MSSQTGLTSGMLFQSINEDLNASLATADELSREFSSLLQEASTSGTSQAASQTTSLIPREKPQSMGSSSFPSSSTATSSTREGSGRAASSVPYSPSPASQHSLDTILSRAKTPPPSSVSSFQSLSSLQPRQDSHSPLPRLGSDSFLYSQQSPEQSPRPQRCDSPIRYNRSPRGSLSYMERSPSPSPTTAPFDQPMHSNQLHPSSGMLSPYDAGQTGRRSPRHERSPSPRHFSHSMASTLPRNFGGFKQTEERSQHQKGPGKWNETDLDASFDRKPHHTYDKTDWLRPSVPNSSWRESNLDGPPPAPSLKKDSLFGSHQPVHGSLPRNARISVPPDKASLAQPPYHPQPIISRISIPPLSPRPRQRQPIPLSVIMRLQNPRWDAGSLRSPRVLGKEGDRLPYLPVAPQPRESLPKPQFQLQPPELRQPAFYSEVLNSGDVDAELEKLDLVHHLPAILEAPGTPERGGEDPGGPAVAPRPLSPTRLQPVVAPEAQNQEIPDLEELLRIRAEIPRALKRRGSVDQALPLKKASHYEPNQYKHLINKLFRRKAIRHKGEQGSENSSSSEGEDFCSPPPLAVTTVPSTPAVHDYRNYHSILRRSRERKESGRRARLSPLVLLLDGSLVGELETVQRAVQEMIDPSQPNDEGITALHNAICGGHYNVVEFLVRIGANVSAPDSHGWTPLHCSASCNDRPLCEFLVRNGAAVMAVTESDGASASQKCDPYAAGFEECESFLRGVEEAMGVENSGVLYALWSYPAQAVDELSFREGDMVTILQKPEGVDWWWASLCGREGFVPNNYFGLFPKVRPKSLC